MTAGPGSSRRGFRTRSRVRTGSAAAAEALVAVPELLHTAGGVEDALLARVERVRCRRDLDVDDGVGVAVLPLEGLLARRGRPGEELGAGSEVIEDDRAVLRVDVLLHSESFAVNSDQAPGAARAACQCPNSALVRDRHAGLAPHGRARPSYPVYTREDCPRARTRTAAR